MPENPAKIFTLAEANDAVQVVADFTADVIQQLAEIRERHGIGPTVSEPDVPKTVLKEVENVLQEWAEQVTVLGAHAKGYFTVDFQSVDPELLYCWTYGEETIACTHKVWENFTNRRPLALSAESLNIENKWVN